MLNNGLLQEHIDVSIPNHGRAMRLNLLLFMSLYLSFLTELQYSHVFYLVNNLEGS